MNILDFVASQQITKMIKRDIETIRMRIFGTKLAPFDNIADAVKWIEKTAAEPLTEEMDELKKKSAETYRVIEKLAQDAKYITVERKAELLNYLDGGEYVKRITVSYHESLEYLSVESKSIAEATGFLPAQVIMYVLCDEQPRISRAEIKRTEQTSTLSSGKVLRQNYITITIRAKDVKIDELRYMYDNMRKELDINRNKRTLTTQQSKICELVEIAGPPPVTQQGVRDRKDKDYWEKIMTMYEEVHPNEPRWGDYKLVKEIYKRAMRNIEKYGIVLLEDEGGGEIGEHNGTQE